MSEKNKKEENLMDFPELVLSSREGVPLATFPLKIVDPIRLMISRVERKEQIPTRLSFVSAIRGEGVSYISLAFGTTLAHDLETTVCIVDLNWWSSNFYSQINTSGGLSATLKGEIPLDCAVIQTGRPNLALLPAGELSIHERAQFARSAILKDTISELNNRYEHLILDIPAVLVSNDAIPLTSLGTAYCLVVHQGVTKIEEIKSAIRDLDHLPSLGVVMNKYRLATPEVLLKFINPY